MVTAALESKRTAPQHTKPAASSGAAVLYVTATCPNCRLIKPLLQSAGIAYQEKDAAAYAEEVRSLGIRQAPTLVLDVQPPIILSGAAQIKGWLKEQKVETL